MTGFAKNVVQRIGAATAAALLAAGTVWCVFRGNDCVCGAAVLWSDSAGGDSADRIQVYFAPCRPDDRDGIDDRFVGFLERARKTIDGAFYDLQLPDVARTLIAKHRAGIHVRIVSDSDYENRAAVQDCIREGIPVVFDRRSALMHNKFCIVDGRFVWTGSTNIADNCMYRNDNNSVLIESEALARSFTVEFEEMFLQKRFGARSPKNTPYPEVQVGAVRVECCFAPEDGVLRRILDEIKGAEKTLDFMAFSFTSRELAEVMARKLNHGVHVRGVLESHGAGSPHSMDDFLAGRGALVRRDGNPGFMHNKVIVVDGKTVITGSYNFSKNAETKNDENVLIIHSPEIAARYLRKLEDLLRN